ncbi:MAG: D-glycero-beta-D-manno-heptose 1-phosphate adenylyltransferase [archaeon]|nr:D-glycero-beta-D-manno-heptose 1-phosphate adenylyltransferase [archaeon]
MNKIEQILSNFIGKKILVIGDLMLDKYVEGEVSRVSPEAPVPVVKVEREFFELGGAGNVASNVASLGGKAILFSFAGKDDGINVVKNLLREKGIEFFIDENYATLQKTRIIGRGQQIVRVDREKICEKIFNEETKKLLLEKARECDIIIISDYAKGSITKDLIEFLSVYKSKMIVDPKPSNQHLYKKVYLITPNEKESLEMSGFSEVNKAGEMLKMELNSHILITKGRDGMTLFSDSRMEIPTYAQEVFDVSGAGDTVIATLALAIAAGSSLEEASIIANHAAGIAVGKKGTYSVKHKELVDKIFSGEKKVVSLQELKEIVVENRRKGKRIVWTNGCFDILHAGHIKYLKKAKEFGDILIVGLNSDDSIRKLKGPTRPVQLEAERAEILSSMEFVDYVYIFSELNTEKYLIELQPDVYVKGGNYNIDTINQIERKIVEGYDGKIALVSFIEGRSTTHIIEKIKGN